MTNATSNERKVLLAIATNDFNVLNGGMPASMEETSDIWLDSINDAAKPSGITGKSLSGVCSSLTKKGFVQSDDECIALTESGLNVLLAS